jgi:hypothetical protein
MNRSLMVLCLLFISAPGIAQNIEKKKKKFKQELHASTKEQIHQLKNGALLVRLKTRTNAIVALRKMGEHTKADAIQQQQAAFNSDIIHAFRKNFNFCPVYFFYSDYSDTIKAKRLDKVVFLNDSLQPDPTVKFEKKNFLIADFGTVEQDTAKTYSYSSMEPDRF